MSEAAVRPGRGRPVEYIVRRVGSSTSAEPTRHAAPRGRYRRLFVASAIVWSLSILAWPASAPYLTLPIGAAALLFAVLSFDFDRHVGRRRIRRSLRVAYKTLASDHRSAPRLHVEIDGEELPADEATRLALARWMEPLPGSGGGPKYPDVELSLVTGRHVYVLGSHSDRDAYPERPGEGGESGVASREPAEGPATQWEVTSVRGLASALEEATSGRLRVDPALFTAGARWKGITATVNHLPAGLLYFAWYLAVFFGLSGVGDAPATWPEAAYVGLFVVATLPLPIVLHAARQASAARGMLQRAYGDVEPLPGGTRLRPWAAFLLTVAVWLTMGAGWALLFPEANRWWTKH